MFYEPAGSAWTGNWSTYSSTLNGKNYWSMAIDAADWGTWSYAFKFNVGLAIAIYVTRSDCLGALSADDRQKENFNVYSNATSDNWIVKLPGSIGKVIRSINITGKNAMLLMPKSSQVTVDATDLSSGLFFYSNQFRNQCENYKTDKRIV